MFLRHMRLIRNMREKDVRRVTNVIAKFDKILFAKVEQKVCLDLTVLSVLNKIHAYRDSASLNLTLVKIAQAVKNESIQQVDTKEYELST